MKQLFISFTFLIAACSVYSQKNTTDRKASFENYGQYLYSHLQLAHETFYKGEFDTLKKNYLFLVSFNIDTNGKIINYNIDEETIIPLVVKNYTKKIIYLTSGRWLPEVKDCKEVISDTITCKISIREKAVISWENLKKVESENPIDLQKDFKLTRAMKFKENEPNHSYLFLTY